MKFEDYHVRPKAKDKKTIQCGFIDCLFFRAREHQWHRRGVTGVLLVFAGVSNFYFPNVVISAGLIGFGIFLVIQGVRVSQRYAELRTRIQVQLWELGAGIEFYGHDLAISDDGFDESPHPYWGQLKGYPVSGLGHACAVTRKGYLDHPFSFSIFSDDAYELEENASTVFHGQ